MTEDGLDPGWLPPGTRIGAYTIRTILGFGGGSTVYEAVSEDGHRFALKMCRYEAGEPGTEDWLKDQRQSRNLLCLEALRGHPNVAQIFAYDRYPDPFRGYLYVVQELVPDALPISSAWARERRVSLAAILQAFLELAELFGDLARAGIRLRDVKPANILVGPDGVPKVVDFDSATFTSTFVRTVPLTAQAASAQPASHGYECPELCLAVLEESVGGPKRAFDYLPRSDLHGLGVVLYEVLAGRHPFDRRLLGPPFLEHVARHVPPRPGALNPSVPPALDEVVMKLLAKNPEERYQHGDEVARDLRALLENAPGSWTLPFEVPEPDPEHPDVLGVLVEEVRAQYGREQASRSKVSLRSWRRHPRAAPMVSLLGALVALVVVTALAWQRAEPPPALPVIAWEAPRDVPLAPAGCTFCGPPELKGDIVPTSAPPASLAVKKSQGRRKASAVAVAACAVGAACAGVKIRREEDLKWLESCPPDARETVHTLGIYPGDPDDEGPAYTVLQKGPNVIPHDIGCEVREGPIRTWTVMSPTTASGWLHGWIREGPDFVSMRFTKLELRDGRTFPVCAIAAHSFPSWGPGVGKLRRGGVPASELNPGYIYVTTGRLRVRLAPYITRRPPGAM